MIGNVQDETILTNDLESLCEMLQLPNFTDLKVQIQFVALLNKCLLEAQIVIESQQPAVHKA